MSSDDKSKWESLATALAKKFKTQALLSNIRDELHNLKQGKESIGEFARKVLAKTKVAFQGEDKNIPRKLAIDLFIKGLWPEIRKAIRRLPETDDFESVVANAEKESRILEQERTEEYKIVDNLNSLIISDKVDTLQKQINSLREILDYNQPSSRAKS